MAIPKSFTVKIGGKVLPFKYFDENTQSGRLTGYAYAGPEENSVGMGLTFYITKDRRLQTEFFSSYGKEARTGWFAGHIKEWGVEFYEFPTVESAIFGFKEFLKKRYISKRASSKKKAQIMHPFGL